MIIAIQIETNSIIITYYCQYMTCTIRTTQLSIDILIIR